VTRWIRWRRCEPRTANIPNTSIFHDPLLGAAGIVDSVGSLDPHGEMYVRRGVGGGPRAVKSTFSFQHDGHASCYSCTTPDDSPIYEGGGGGRSGEGGSQTDTWCWCVVYTLYYIILVLYIIYIHTHICSPPLLPVPPPPSPPTQGGTLGGTWRGALH
jgi:hypothetical protein